jgi:hypothetical protein
MDSMFQVLEILVKGLGKISRKINCIFTTEALRAQREGCFCSEGERTFSEQISSPAGRRWGILSFSGMPVIRGISLAKLTGRPIDPRPGDQEPETNPNEQKGSLSQSTRRTLRTIRKVGDVGYGFLALRREP